MALATNALVSLAEAKERLDRPADIPRADEKLIENLINRSATRIESHLDRDLKAGTVTEHYDGSGTGTLWVRRYPLTSVSELNVDPNRDFFASTDIDPTDVVIDSERGTVRFFPGSNAFRSSFATGVKNVKIVYTGGFTIVPEDLKEASLILVARSFMRIRQGAEGIISESVAGYSASYEGTTRESGLPLEVQGILTRYKRVKNL